MGNRLAMTALGLWGVTALAAAALYVNHRRAIPVDGEQRVQLVLPAHAASAVRAEMRAMLGSVHDVLRALPAGDRTAVREAALRSGTAMAVDPELERLLPEEFLRLGMRTHAGFDTLAGLARAPGDTVIARLAGITAECVACHATYRMPEH
jgi:hypothetical protein